MMHRRTGQAGWADRRRRAAKACLTAMALTWLVVPGLHALVHHAEEAREERVREFALAHQHRHHQAHPPDHDHDHDGDHDGGGPGRDHDHDLGGAGVHHHQHDGDPAGGGSPLHHGDGAPEHLGLAVLDSAPPAVPVPGAAIESLAPPPPVIALRTAACPRAHGSRAPPRDLASDRRTI